MKHILIANIFGIGDVLFTTPLLSNLKKAFPDSEIDYMCNIRASDAVSYNPEVNSVFVYEKDIFLGIWKESKLRFLRAAKGLFDDIRSRKYDLVFDFTLSKELGLFFKLAGIPKRIGLDYKARGLFLTDKVPFRGFKDKHVIEHYLDCLRCLDIDATIKDMKLFTDAISQEMILSRLREKGIDEEAGPLVAVIPGGGASWGKSAGRKRWDGDYFSRVADILAEKGSSLAVIGDASESDLCRTVADRMKKRPAFVMNNLTLPDYIAFLNSCDLVLCNDGGPLHMAVALGVKTVSVFGPVDDAVYGPYPSSGKHRVIINTDIDCRPCYNRFRLPECGNDNRCLSGIAPEKAAGECLRLLKNDGAYE